MEAMYTNGCFFVDDDLLNFSLDEEDEEPQQQQKKTTTTTTTTTTVKEHSFSSSFSLESSDHHPISHHDDDVHLHNHSFPEYVEEELEWLSNKDAFPGVETCLDIFPDNPGLALDHHSPVSVLENSSSSSESKTNGNGNGQGNESTISSCCGGLHVPRSYPVGKRSKRRRSRRRAGFPDLPSQQSLMLSQVHVKNKNQEPALPLSPMSKNNSSSSIGRRCLHCLAEKTPQWRAGPMGPKTLCNACGVRYKSGRLVPEYRPASSPTFSAAVHSNSHRKIIEMRRQKQMMTGGVAVNQACGYRVG